MTSTLCATWALSRDLLERTDPADEAQDRAYAERIMDAREATRATGSGGGGVMVPPLSSAHEWGHPPRARATELPAFGHEGTGGVHREGAGEPDRFPREGVTSEQGRGGEALLPPYARVKQEDDYVVSPLDDYFCRGVDTSGPASWDLVLQSMATGGRCSGREVDFV